MAISRSKEKVRDGYLGDLPQDIQKKVMDAHKMVIAVVEDTIEKDHYSDLKDSSWAMSCIDDFCVMPKDKDQVGSIRVYRNGKKYKCMIQLTGHFRNHQYGWIEELLHEFIKDVYTTAKIQIRKKLDMRLDNEGSAANPFEGFDIYPNPKVVKDIWDSMEDRKTLTMVEGYEFDEDEFLEYTMNPNYKPNKFLNMAIKSGNIEIVREALTGIIQADPGFRTNKIYDAIAYAQSHNLDPFVTENDPDLPMNKDGKWDSKYFATTVTYLRHNFTKERFEHCREVGIATHPYAVTSSEEGSDPYKKRLSDEEFSNLVKSKSSAEIKNDIESVQAEINELKQSGEGSKKKDLLVVLRENLKKLIDWLTELGKSIGRSLGLVESIMYEYGDQYSCRKLPNGLQKLAKETNMLVYDTIKELSKDPKYSALTSREDDFKKFLDSLDGSNHNKEQIGFTIITDADEDIKVTIVVTPEPRSALTSWSPAGDSAGDAQNALNVLMKDTEKKLRKKFHRENPTKYLELIGNEDKNYFAIICYGDYAHKLKDHLDNPKNVPFTEAGSPEEYNSGMSEAEAKKTLRALSQTIINDKGKKVTQYTANIYANVITKNLLPKWAPGFHRFHITLDDYQSFHYFNFKVPKMTPDFIERFINGREKFSGLLHRDPVINVKMSPRLFSNMENPDDAFNFFKAAIQYYNNSLEKYAEKLMTEVVKLDTPTKHLIATTKLSGIVTIPMSILFNFSDVQMSKKGIFKVSKGDIDTIQQFVKNITSRYAAPEKEKTAIISDLREIVRSLQESVGFSMNENMKDISYLPEAVQQYYDGKFDSTMESVRDKIREEQVDYVNMRTNPNPQVKYLQEKFGVKKLKKIPADLVAYITIETEAIKDANDKMMIASYCLGKIEIVEWYIELLEVGSNKYVVPHTKPYLESVRTQLLACYKKIMATPIPKTQDRPLIDIQYPKGYEG